ncbi:MAG TPA: 16S rRNA (cytosine(1402)-N(4))-methyltransferase RsmH [Acidobacteriota bacterium]|nr:16S rRNA (cytosine(1402)-N(4))-methyltransferase RsmH [Acidobacteriota bacterium]
MAVEHIPVLLDEAVELLNVRPGKIYVDATVGLGGHAKRILAQLQGHGQLIALDRDEEALEIARAELGGSPLVSFYRENFKNLPLILRNIGIDKIDGCLLDLGVSTLQLLTPERGFSFQEEGPLDMRMDREQRTTAAHLVNQLPEPELVRIFKEFGEEPQARKIAAAIVARRRQAAFQTTGDLARLIEKVKGRRHGRIHPATRVFQALRIEVNQELVGLEEFLEHTIDLLNPQGRLVIIAFHSLEDRIVKRTFQKQAGKCICFKPRDLCTCPRRAKISILTRKPLYPSEAEISRNPRARSARLRAAERTAEE